MTTVVVQSCPGREELTLRTLDLLDGWGGAAQLAREGRAVFFWTGLDAPIRPPLGWAFVHNTREPRGERLDLWDIFRAVQGDDLLLIEDDVSPCKNAVPYMANWDAGPHTLTTFHNMLKRPHGSGGLDPSHGYGGNQAIKIPRDMLDWLVMRGDTDPRPQLAREGGDVRIARLIGETGRHVYYHRSLVQHVGERSIHNPSAKLTGVRAPDPDFDIAYDPTK